MASGDGHIICKGIRRGGAVLPILRMITSVIGPALSQATELLGILRLCREARERVVGLTDEWLPPGKRAAVLPSSAAQLVRDNWLSNRKSSPTTIYSTTVAMLGTNSSISRGPSCPSVFEIGRMGSDQRALVLVHVVEFQKKRERDRVSQNTACSDNVSPMAFANHAACRLSSSATVFRPTRRCSVEKPSSARISQGRNPIARLSWRAELR
jgi:hypothetical protein